jgi:hypothetical protein
MDKNLKPFNSIGLFKSVIGSGKKGQVMISGKYSFYRNFKWKRQSNNTKGAA